MLSFIDYLKPRLEKNGYRCARQTPDDLFAKTDDGKLVWVIYLDKPLEPEQIRRCFEFPGHVLFVVNEKLIPDTIESRQNTPMWLRVLHGLYMGRIYVWNGRHLFGLHFDYDTDDVSESGIIQPDELLLIETGTWLRGWTGTYRLARFKDKQWWADDRSKPPYNYRQPGSQQTPPRHEYTYNHDGGKQQSDARAEYEQGRDHYWEQQRARENAQSNYQWRYRDVPPHEYPPQPPPGNASSKRDFMREFAQAGSPSAIKALFRKLAREFHPDLNPGKDTTAEMQAINAAYERFK